MSMQYEICTEAVHVGWIRGLATVCFPDGYRLTAGMGYDKGKEKSSLTVTVIDGDPVTVERFANEVKAWNNQDAVLVITTTCDTQYI